MSLTPGGSSGGEGALVGFRGSIMGVGTDIGGSIRVASFCNGIHGFKPTANRVPYGGQKSPGRLGSPGIPAVAGPHAHSAANLPFFTKQVFLAKPWTRDSTAVGSPWREIPGTPVLDIGVIISDADFPVNPSVTRTMHSAIEKLNLAGHNVKVLSNFPPIMEGTKIASKFFMLDNKRTSLQHIKAGGEECIEALKYASPTRIVEARPCTLDDVWDAQFELQQYRQKVFYA